MIGAPLHKTKNTICAIAAYPSTCSNPYQFGRDDGHVSKSIVERNGGFPAVNTY
jgi:hypothetical protein